MGRILIPALYTAVSMCSLLNNDMNMSTEALFKIVVSEISTLSICLCQFSCERGGRSKPALQVWTKREAKLFQAEEKDVR